MTEPITSLPQPLSSRDLADYEDLALTDLMSPDAATVVGAMRDRLVDEVRRLWGESR